MAKAAGIRPLPCQRIWHAHGLKPHLTQDLQALARSELRRQGRGCRRPLSQSARQERWFCAVDEKSQIQALDRTQPGLPMKKGRAGTMTHDYKRNGTTTLFAALNMLDGKVIGTCMPRHRHREFLRFLRHIDQQTPTDLDLHLIADNYATHKTPGGKRWLKAPSALSSALHADLGILAQHGRTVLRRDHPKRASAAASSKASPNSKTPSWTTWTITMPDPKPFVWTKSAGEILEKSPVRNKRWNHNTSALEGVSEWFGESRLRNSRRR